MMSFSQRSGFTLIETMMFSAILAVLSGTILGVYISVQNARIRQLAISEVEQGGSIVMSRIATAIRGSEAILLPPADSQGEILALQQRENAKQPTIILATSTGDLLLVQRANAQSMISSRVTIDNFSVHTQASVAATISFDLVTVIPSFPPQTYRRHFQTTALRTPDDVLEAGGCGSCPAPVCAGGILTWQECVDDVCTTSDLTLPCSS